jgi:hypothetical protein
MLFYGLSERTPQETKITCGFVLIIVIQTLITNPSLDGPKYTMFLQPAVYDFAPTDIKEKAVRDTNSFSHK